MFTRKKKMEDTGDRPLLQGAIEKSTSYIMAVPRSREELGDQDTLVRRLKETALFRLISYKPGDEMTVVVEYGGGEYELRLFPEKLELPELYTIGHQFSKVDAQAMRSAGGGLTAAMTFGQDIPLSYQVQLKVLACILPGMVGLVDFCAERILSGVWAEMAARSSVPPAPSYIYTIQAVSGDDGTVWLHTHGLNRCGSVELEILGSDEEHYQSHAAVLQTVAGNTVAKAPLGPEREPFWVSTLSDGARLMGTWISWPVAVRFYGRKAAGGAADRRESHNENTGILYFYASPEDTGAGRLTPISSYDDRLGDNPVMMISTEETERMRRLAAERLDFFRREIVREQVRGLMKFGLPADEAYRSRDGENLEHLWFEVLRMDGSAVLGRSIQDAYYIDSLREGTELRLDLADLTDWMLYTPECQVTPDSVYLLEIEE